MLRAVAFGSRLLPTRPVKDFHLQSSAHAGHTNARYLENFLFDRAVGSRPIRHVILMCSAINEIDLSALESLEAINQRLQSMGVTLHLSEVKGPVMDRLQRLHILDGLTGRVFLSQFEAVQALSCAEPRVTAAEGEIRQPALS